MQNSCISSVEITLKYFQVIDLIASIFLKKNIRCCLNHRGPKGVQKGVNEASNILTK